MKQRIPRTILTSTLVCGRLRFASNYFLKAPEADWAVLQEPGQARRGYRPPSALGLGFDFDLRPTQDNVSASQRSAFFPWDHAGASSSVAGAPFDFDGSDGFSALRPASKRGVSVGSRRDSLLLPGGGLSVPPSPADLGLRNSLAGGEDFQFNG